MGNSKIIIAVVVAIIVIKLLAVHLYLKTKIDKSASDKDSNEEE